MPTVDERRRYTIFGKARRAAWAWFMDTDMATLEKIFMFLQCGFVVALIAFSDRIIAKPPPLFQRGFPVLATYWWIGALVIGLVWQMRGHISKQFCTRRNGSIFSFFTCLSIVGPVYLKAPLFAIVMFCVLIWQGTLTARLVRLCQMEHCD